MLVFVLIYSLTGEIAAVLVRDVTWQLVTKHKEVCMPRHIQSILGLLCRIDEV